MTSRLHWKLMAVILSFMMVKRVLGPLTSMTELTRDITAGNYHVDIPVRSMDEVGQLAVAFDVRKLIDRTLDSFRMEFEKKAISVKVMSETALLMLRADEAKITQVIQNLVHNAVQYTQPGGKLRVDLKSTPSELKIVFSNSGGGIDSADLPYVFERFYRGEKSRSREHGGAGIGLAIVKELVEAHGGCVGADIRSGQTEIWFSLSLLREKDAQFKKINN